MNKLFLSVVIPVYNESARILPTLDKVSDYLDRRGAGYEIIVVNDGSLDNTSGAVSGFFKKRPVGKLIEYAPNRGKGKAVREGVLASVGEFVLYMDADCSTPVEEMEKGLKILQEGRAEIAIASRYLEQSRIDVSQPPYRRWGRLVFQKIFYGLMGLQGFTDTQCGFKLLKGDSARELFKLSRVVGYMFDIEILVLAKKLDKGVKEFPVNWRSDVDSRFRPFYDTARMFLHLAQISYRTFKTGD